MKNNTIAFANTLQIDLIEYAVILKRKGFLSQRDVQILSYRNVDISFETIALRFNIKKERVANIERSLLAKLKHKKYLKEINCNK